jgi:hypothetical protein
MPLAATIVPAIREGATYALAIDMNEADALAYWMAPEKETFIAEDGDAVVRTHYLRHVRAGGEGHVCI